MDPYIGEVRAFGFNYAPVGWAFCDGQLLSISQYTALFSILGTTYGGDGVSNFALPNLQNGAPMHWGSGQGLTPRTLGEVLGTNSVTLTAAETPSHNHTIQTAQANAPAQESGTPSGTSWLGNSLPGTAYSDSTAALDSSLAPNAIGVSGGSQPHQNMQPILALNFCIALEGIFPPHA
jgi:microcystin-dependent protein